MNLRPDYVPTRVEHAVQEILNNLTDEDRARFITFQGEVSYHLTTFGFQIRDAWGLTNEKSPLVRHCKMRIGPAIPEAYALFILAEVWSKICAELRNAGTNTTQPKDVPAA